MERGVHGNNLGFGWHAVGLEKTQGALKIGSQNAASLQASSCF